MRSFDVCLIAPHARLGEPSARLGVPLLDEYLRFLAGRCRPNTVLAAAYDLKVFFTIVGKTPEDVRPADVLAFVTAQRSGRSSIDGVLQAVDDKRAGVSSSTVRRRLSSVSGLYAFLHARGDVPTNPVPARVADPPGTSTAAAGCAVGAVDANVAAHPDPGRGRCPDGCAAHASGPSDGGGDGARRAPALRGPRASHEGSAGRGAAGVRRRGHGRSPAADTDLRAGSSTTSPPTSSTSARPAPRPIRCSWS
jgi:Phage integrase, N-terminal SAM-like domain